MRVAVRWLFVCAGLIGIGAQSSATTVTVVATGTLTTFVDSNSVTDGSIAIGSPYTMTMKYDDTVPDGDSDPTFGGYSFPGAQSTYTVAVGNYTFDASGTLLIGVLDGYNDPAEDQLVWYAEDFSIDGPLDAGVTVGPVTWSNPSLYDFSGSAFGSDDLSLAVWNRSLYAPSTFAFNLFVEVLDPRTPGRDSLDMSGSIAGLVVTLPEASVSLLLAGIGAVLLRRGA